MPPKQRAAFLILIEINGLAAAEQKQHLPLMPKCWQVVTHVNQSARPMASRRAITARSSSSPEEVSYARDVSKTR